MPTPTELASNVSKIARFRGEELAIFFTFDDHGKAARP